MLSSEQMTSLSLRARLKTVMFDRVPGLLRRGPASSRRVAITFDDGPDELTPRYLDVLDELGVPATFFILGDQAERHPDLVRDYVRRGHQVAGHGFDHTRFTKLSVRELLDQVRRTDAAIGGSPTGHPWVRPPHGSLDARSIVALRAAGYVIALWTVDSCDYSDRDPAKLAGRCAPAHVSGGDVMLFHEGQEWTLEALPRIVAALHAAGLECVTMQDLFAR
ncbi:MAG TPA: polysaccharide deacetylase family protein [Kofleriaceae bacterium]|jgi:peptidoglycan/xylan/chitin deacetylase (PgdA/CDA1 family)